MQADKMTVKVREAAAEAAELARRGRHPEVTPVHLFLAFMSQDGGILPGILERLGVPVPDFTQELDRELARLPEQEGGDLSFSRELTRLFDAARRHMDKMKDRFLSTEHLVLAGADGKAGAASDVFKRK
jgi:ATP-dependent Clp protease ATP-binding subunit ClpB